jgi:alpha-L-rhamnosidase
MMGGPVFFFFFPDRYHGFRYVEVQNYPGTLSPSDIQQIHFRTANPVQSTFSSSSPVLNQIQTGALIGQGSNMMSVPTDCDQRDERLGWVPKTACCA